MWFEEVVRNEQLMIEANERMREQLQLERDRERLQFALDHQFSSDEGFSHTPHVSSDATSSDQDSSDQDPQFWIGDHGFESVDDHFETDDEDPIERMNRREILRAMFEPDDDEISLTGTPSGSIEDFVSDVLGGNLALEQDIGDYTFEDYDSGDEADDESEEGDD